MTTCTFTSMKPIQSAFPRTTTELPSISSSSSSLPQLGGQSGFRRVCTTDEPTACPIPGLAAGVLEMRVKEGSKIRNLLGFVMARMQREEEEVDGSQIQTMLSVKEGVTVDRIQMGKRQGEGVMDIVRSQTRTWLSVKEGVTVDRIQMGKRQGEGVMDIVRSQTRTGLRVRQVVFTGSGKGITKTITCVEILKRKVGGLHQLSKLHYKTVSEVWESQETDMTPRSRMTVHKTVPAISILLSKHPLDPSEPGYQPPETLHDPSYQPQGYQPPRYQPPETLHDPSYQPQGYQPPRYQPPETLHDPSYQPQGYQPPRYQPPETLHDPSYQPPGYQPPRYQPPETLHDPSYQPQGYQPPRYQPPVTLCDSVKIQPRPQLELRKTQLLSIPLTQKSQSTFWFQNAGTSRSQEGSRDAQSCTPHLYAASEKERKTAGGEILYSPCSYILPGPEAKRTCMENHLFPSTPST
ncbi:adhesive plaque matrix protein-like isoform X2 [Oncorhynchus keta]|uniref:adhesive plaque matrix protein-like isoform X2 n=1 Tax=Oncorhynchus keta TaxID=8018 RepID=UPI00227A7591|nr:adhesive plaque matrix protein-like isoform X2 [Oncorhynchus keta]